MSEFDQARHELYKGVEKLQETIESAREQLAEAVEKLEHQGRQSFRQAQKQGTRMWKEAREVGEDYLEDGRTWAKRNPERVLGFAFLAGVAACAFLMPRRHR